MDKGFVLFIIIIIVLGFFYIGDRIVDNTKQNPNKSNEELIGGGIAQAGKDAGRTIGEIGNQVIQSINIETANISNATADITLTKNI